MEGAANRLLRALAQQFCWQTQFCRCCNRRCRGDGALEKCPCLLELTPPKFCSLQPLLFWSSASHTCSDRTGPFLTIMASAIVPAAWRYSPQSFVSHLC